MHVVHNTTERRCTMYNVQLQCPLSIITESLFTWGESIIVSDFTISVYGSSCTVLSFCPISLLFLHNFLATCLGDEIAKAKEREWGRKRDNYMMGRILYCMYKHGKYSGLQDSPLVSIPSFLSMLYWLICLHMYIFALYD